MKKPIDLRHWGTVTINGSGPHLVGNPAFGHTRMSTELVVFEPGSDEHEGYAETLSGQTYTLVDAPATREQVINHVLSLTGGVITSYDIQVVAVDDAVAMLDRAAVVRP
jgi:hypothetical protein